MIELYVVMNDKNQYFRAKGYGGHGQTWVDDITKAKVYGTIRAARRTVTFFANNYKDYPPAKLMKLVVAAIEHIDETERIEKAKKAKLVAIANREINQKKRILKAAQENLDKATRELSMAKCNSL